MDGGDGGEKEQKQKADRDSAETSSDLADIGSDLQIPDSKTLKAEEKEKKNSELTEENNKNPTQENDVEKPTNLSEAFQEKINDLVDVKENVNRDDSMKDQKPDKNMDGSDKTNKIRASSKEEKHEEDVPEDFFDDFLKEDFMAGLDIVDEDDEDQEDKIKARPKPQKKRSTDKKERKPRDSRISSKEKIDHVKKFRESPPGELKKNIKKSKNKKKTRDSELKKLNAELEEIRNVKPKKPDPSKSGVDADNFDIRRDPEKTRQAIQRDKIKTAKDKEKRLITDIVETGLVPPGMELEVDIEEVRRAERIENNMPIGDLRQRIRPRKTKSKSSDRIRSTVKKRTPPKKRSHSLSKRRKSRSPTKKKVAASTSVQLHVPGAEPALDYDKKKSKSRRTLERSASRRSPLKMSPILQRSPVLRRSPVSRRSPLHSTLLRRSPLRPSPLLRRSPLLRHISPRRHSPSKRRSPILRRRSRSRSLTRRRSRSRSPVQHRRSRSRNHSPTYRRRRDRSYSPRERERRRRSRSPLRKEEKMSFLEELAAKLNETHPPQPTLAPPPVTYILPAPQPVITPVPAPVPPPQPVFFSAPAPQQFDREFDHYDQSFFIGTSAPLPDQEEPYLIQQPLDQRGQQVNGYPRDDADLNSSRDMSKLFGDQRIKLSDFLAITAKPQVNNSSPAKLQEKIKVIQRCQEAIRILNERRFTGPLVVHKTDSYQISQDMTMSPLLRKPIIQLPFTTPGLKKSTDIDFTKCCETLLYRIGIEKTLTLHKGPENPKVLPPKEVPQKEIAPPIYPVTQRYSETPTPIKAITKNLSTQTDKELSSCKDCLRRKGILYANCGVQAGNPTVTFSVSTQVNEADFYSMIPKTQSLASLTPAQLLGKQSMIARGNFQVPSPPPPPIFNFMVPQSSQRDAGSYAPPLYCQTSIPSLMQVRPNFNDDKNKPTFPDNRRGGYSKRRF